MTLVLEDLFMNSPKIANSLEVNFHLLEKIKLRKIKILPFSQFLGFLKIIHFVI